jgi:hypothetical protein
MLTQVIAESLGTFSGGITAADKQYYCHLSFCGSGSVDISVSYFLCGYYLRLFL